jgi:hypothetical protein
LLTRLFPNGRVVAIAVLVRYEFLHRVPAVMPRMRCRHGLRIVPGVCAALIAHMVEIAFFGLVHYLANQRGSGAGSAATSMAASSMASISRSPPARRPASAISSRSASCVSWSAWSR